MGEDLKRLISVRGAYRGHCTRTVKTANELMNSFSPDLDVLEDVFEGLCSRMERLSLQNQKIELAVSEDKIEEEISQTLEYTDDLMQQKNKIAKFLRVAKAQVKQEQEENKSASSKFTTKKEAIHVKLPKITLKSFSGNPIEWLSFWDSFQASVDKNSDISGVDKMNYLSGLLRGEAARVIQGLPLSESNYQRAVDLLKERFGQKQVLINAHMDALLKIPSATNDVKKLRSLYDAYEGYIHGLESLGVYPESYGDLLIPIVMKKLPEEVRRIMLRSHDETTSTLADLRKQLRHEVETREKSSLGQSDKEVSAPNPSFNSKFPTAGALFFGALGRENAKNGCTFCDGPHPSDSCKIVSTIDQRLEFLRNQKRCFRCFKTGHMSKSCYSKKRCSRCNGKHHSALCKSTGIDGHKSSRTDPAEEVTSNANTRSPEKDDSTIPEGSTLVGSTHTSQDTILLQSALVDIAAGSRSCQARLLFDSGSQRTFISQDLAKKIGAQPFKKERLLMSTFGQDRRTKADFEMVRVCLVADREEIVINALVSPVISPPISAHLQDDDLNFPYLQGLRLADPVRTRGPLEIDIIIGNDYYGSLVTGEIIKGDGPMAMNSKFGWLLSGPVIQAERPTEHMETRCRIEVIPAQDDETLNEILPRFWELHSLGIADSLKEDEDEVLRHFNESVSFNEQEGRYTVQLPWKQDRPPLPSNLGLCKKRLRALVGRLGKNPEQLVNYDQIIHSQLKEGFIEKVENPYRHIGTLHYIPHHPVIKEERVTTKIRIVYDASARISSDAPSLNDCLHVGPSLLPDLSALLMKFRVPQIAMTADIEKAFLQVELSEVDRDATRFLWIKNLQEPINAERNIECYRFRRVLFGASPSPFLLGATLKHHLDKQKDDWVAEDLKNSMYVDNVLSGASNDDDADHYYSHSRQLLASAGMNLRQWTTNSSKLKEKLVAENTIATDKPKVLGLEWDSNADTISFPLKTVVSETKALHGHLTKRSVLSIAAKVFDPLGLLEPFTVRAKMMLQELWKQKISWDSQLPEELKAQWWTWFEELETVPLIQTPRPYFPSGWSGPNLHVFGDSSKKAYGAVAYLRAKQESDVHTTIVMAKSKIAPMKSQTTPRLELLASLVAARLSHFISEKLKPKLGHMETTLWSDSEIVLSWLCSKKLPDSFVSKRIEEIKKLTNQHQWRYCPSASNPADLLSRGVAVGALVDECSIWWKGPKWLSQSVDSWPVWRGSSNHVEHEIYQGNMETVCLVTRKPSSSLLNVIDPERYSSLNKLLAVTSHVIRFTTNCKSGEKDRKSGPLTTQELSTAMTLWTKAIQSQAFSREILQLSKKDSKLSLPLVRQLRLYLDDNAVLRCRGRLESAPLDDQSKFPILLPRNEHFTKLAALAAHEQVLHSGVRETLAQLREKYWVPRGRQFVRSLVRKCVTCRKTDGPPYRPVSSPPLPPLRVSEGQAFNTTGVDYAGPLYVKSSTGDRSPTKVYIALFTCAVVRAVHLEVAEDLSSESFIRAFRRFVSRRGVPERLISDNAKNFKDCSKRITSLSSQILEAKKTQRYLASHGIRWQFIIERAPWWGGFYERLVGSVKRCLKKSLGKTLLSFPDIVTMVTEVEAVLNSRPLTYLYPDIEDNPPLTPAHFLCGYRLTTLPNLVQEKEDVDPLFIPPSAQAPRSGKQELSRRIRHYESQMTTFWTRWRREYLLNLREFHHQPIKGPFAKKDSSVTIGDVVLVHENLPRSRWRLALVEKLIAGRDGSCRAAQVKLANGNRIQRPLQLLFPLEVQDTLSDHKEKNSEDNKSTSDPADPQRPPKRKAAIEARQKFTC